MNLRLLFLKKGKCGNQISLFFFIKKVEPTAISKTFTNQRTTVSISISLQTQLH